jgi:hypothetical protein
MNPVFARIGRHAAALGPAVYLAAAAAPADAATVLRSGLSITIPSNDAGRYLNVITGETGTSTFANPAGWDVNLFGSISLFLYTPPLAIPGGGAYVGSGTQFNFMLHSFGVSVGPSDTFTGTGVVAPNLSSPFFLPSVGQYGIGFRFFNEATSAVHYGFMYLELGNTLGGQPRRLMGYYYESQPGVALVLPSPGAATALALLSTAASRRRRSLRRIAPFTS